MSARTFLDTNVLVYLFDSDAPEKQARARDIIADESLELVVSTQVLGEFYVVTTRKLTHPLDAADAADAVKQFSEFVVATPDLTTIRAAIETSRRSQVSYWDALIIEAARSAQCGRVLTEDLDSGSVISGIVIENPFTID